MAEEYEELVPAVAVGPEGVIYVAWQAEVGGGQWGVYVSNSSDGGYAWSQETITDTIGHMPQNVSIGVDKNGIAYVSWDVWGGIYVSTSSDGGDTWSSPFEVTSYNNECGGDADLTVGESVAYVVAGGGCSPVQIGAADNPPPVVGTVLIPYKVLVVGCNLTLYVPRVAPVHALAGATGAACGNAVSQRSIVCLGIALKAEARRQC